ncbi:hypothetical protein MMC27_002006 [Xylographa pallens]|nr:hypothetical protein [Xylographa pallens]
MPSKLQSNGTLYDDFPWVHQLTAPKAHASAPFLPWHRYYIHAYEKAWKENCDYNGHLPYWDWSQDFQTFTAAPVWDPRTGFGGDGDAAKPSTVVDGRCIVDGPFAGTEALYYAENIQPHCLSRGFEQDERLQELGELIRPAVLEELMRESAFETFAPELERRAYTFISRSIRGDFSRYTGPYDSSVISTREDVAPLQEDHDCGAIGLVANGFLFYADPVFFLHHANLDRLWAKWQMLDPEYQMTAYRGKANSFTSEPASLADLLDVGGLLEPVPVSSVMDTTGGIFCTSTRRRGTE